MELQSVDGLPSWSWASLGWKKGYMVMYARNRTAGPPDAAPEALRDAAASEVREVCGGSGAGSR